LNTTTPALPASAGKVITESDIVIHTGSAISETRDQKRPEFGLVVEKLEVLNQEVQCVMACEHLLLVRRRS
jgi:hypothetical protein